MGGSLSKHNWRSDRSKSKSSASTLQIKTDSDKEEQKIQKEKKVKKMPKYVSSSSYSQGRIQQGGWGLEPPCPRKLHWSPPLIFSPAIEESSRLKMNSV